MNNLHLLQLLKIKKDQILLVGKAVGKQQHTIMLSSW